MKKLPKPNFGVDEVVQSCASSLRDKVLAAKLVAAISVFAGEEKNYARQGRIGQLHKVEGSKDVNGCLTVGEMSKLYKGTLSRGGSLTRKHYDRIKMLAPGDICPLCAQRVVSTLDHHLPKSTHPALALTPLNLVPACLDCNKEKLHRVAQSAEDQTLHPYYDDVDAGTWLVAAVHESSPPAVLFSVRKDSDFDIATLSRLQTHFQTFGLARLYAAHAAAELANIEHLLSDLAQAGGPKRVKRYLRQQAAARQKAARNSWNAATYTALAESDWFCNEGYAL